MLKTHTVDKCLEFIISDTHIIRSDVYTLKKAILFLNSCLEFVFHLHIAGGMARTEETTNNRAVVIPNIQAGVELCSRDLIRMTLCLHLLTGEGARENCLSLKLSL